MTRFQLKPAIYEIDTVKEFMSEFSVGSGDLVFTHRFLYEGYMSGLNLACDFLIVEDYGEGEPADTWIDKILRDLYGKKIDRIIGIGGGTVLDIAKLLGNSAAKTTEEIFEDQVPPIRDRGLVLIPTTCGTGCEVTCVSVVDITKRNAKIGKRVDANFADSAVLIPELLDRLPDLPFLYSSVDALIHAMEIYLAPTTNRINDIFCARAISMILNRYKLLAEHGLAERQKYLIDFLRASCYAGIALSNTVCGPVHACAMHFGSKHHVPHGESNYRFLSAVFQSYAEKAPEGRIRDIAALINEALGVNTDTKGAFQELRKLLEQLIPGKRLRDYGMAEDSVEEYVDKVIETQQRLLINNYVPLGRQDLIAIYEQIV